MPNSRRNSAARLDDASFRAQKAKSIPHKFVLEAISSVVTHTRWMFGCLALYVEDKIVLIIRDKPDSSADNGVWLATAPEHHDSLRREFPRLRSIQLLGKKITGWQLLPSDAPDFEQAALKACELVLAGDPRIGKVPKPRRTKKARKSVARSNGRNRSRSA